MIKITKLLCLAQLKDTDPDLFVDSGIAETKCGNCKKIYKPTDAVIYLHVTKLHIGSNAENAVNILIKDETYIWKGKKKIDQVSRDTTRKRACESHGLQETPIVWRNSSVTFARITVFI